MKLSPTPLTGAHVVDIEPIEDSRGFFARTVCAQAFAEHRINGAFVQQSVSWNRERGILRGLHYQSSPFEEDKLVRVTRGAIFDVIVDLRAGSPTLHQWFGIELTVDNHRALYVPKGFAHGFQTLANNTEVLYQMTVNFYPEAARGVRWNDPAFNINWPDPENAILSDRDAKLPLLQTGGA